MTPKKENKKSQDEMFYHGQSVASGRSVPGINNPEIELPAFYPPVPNRAWTAMREELGKDLVDPENRSL